MNKHLYRVIFQPSTNALIAVAEHASARRCISGSPCPPGHAGVSARWPDCRFRRPRFTSLAFAVVLLWGEITLVSAQIVAAPDAAGAQRPVVDNTANGLPLVQITAPNASGISHNQYQQFNVDSRGTILNNANSAALTQQGGWVAANPNLGSSGARLILNEVTSNNHSQLQGYLEVAGQRADVVVSNPNGIYVNGAGFINTGRAVLTTGVPVFGGSGSLEAFRVTSGQIQIDGGGLNGSASSQLDLIARSVQVNAELWADQLNVVTGSNRVDYRDLNVQLIAGSGDVPSVVIDVAALGGIYTNKIRLVGTEAGVGVRSYGKMAANAGDFQLDHAASVAYSQGAALWTGAAVGGASYTLGAGAGAVIDYFATGQNIGTGFDQRFSYPGLGAAMTVGGLTGMYSTAMFGWAGVPNSFTNWATIPGFVIRANSTIAGKAAGSAAQGAVNSSTNR